MTDNGFLLSLPLEIIDSIVISIQDVHAYRICLLVNRQLNRIVSKDCVWKALFISQSPKSNLPIADIQSFHWRQRFKELCIDKKVECLKLHFPYRCLLKTYGMMPLFLLQFIRGVMHLNVKTGKCLGQYLGCKPYWYMYEMDISKIAMVEHVIKNKTTTSKNT